MLEKSVLTAIKQLNRPVFTTHDVATSCQSSSSNVIQALMVLQKNGIVRKIARGLWVLELGDAALTAYSVISFLMPRQRVYVSFVSALHLWGIIEQIPQVVTLASTGHTRQIRTYIGNFSVHKIAPLFFKGFDWYQKGGKFLIAEPEKALIDCLYLSSYKKKQFGYFPEMRFSKTFSFKKAAQWVKEIPSAKIRFCVEKKLKSIMDKGSV